MINLKTYRTLFPGTLSTPIQDVVSFNGPSPFCFKMCFLCVRIRSEIFLYILIDFLSVFILPLNRCLSNTTVRYNTSSTPPASSLNTSA